MSGLNFNPLAFALSKIEGIGSVQFFHSQESKIRQPLLVVLILLAILCPQVALSQSNLKGGPTEVIDFCDFVHLEWPSDNTNTLSFNVVNIMIDQNLKEMPQTMSLTLEWAESDSIKWIFANGGLLNSYGVEVHNMPGYAMFTVDFKKINSVPTIPLFAIQCLDMADQPVSARYAARHGIVITINIECRYSTISEQKLVQFEDQNFMPASGNGSLKIYPEDRELQIWDMNGHQVGRFKTSDSAAEKEALSLLPRGIYLIVDPSKERPLPTRKVCKL